MNAGPSPAQEVPVDVLPPVPKDAAVPLPPVPAESRPPLGALRTFYHPASGVVILGVDLLAFGPDLLSGFLDMPLTCFLSFVVTLPLVFLIQLKWSKDGKATAFGKAFIGAFLAGLPFPVAGTVLGAAVLALAGLPSNPAEAFKKVTSPQGGSSK